MDDVYVTLRYITLSYTNACYIAFMFMVAFVSTVTFSLLVTFTFTFAVTYVFAFPFELT